MAYVVPGDSGYANCPFYEIENMSELTAVAPLVVEGDYSYSYGNMETIWKSGDASIGCYNTAGAPYIEFHRMSPPGGQGVQNGWPYYVIVAFAQKLSTPNTYNNYILFFGSASDDPTAALADAAAGRWTTDNQLYAYPNASGLPPFLEDLRDWDETPTEDVNDPDNLLPQGGEFADLGSFEETVQQLYGSLPDPEATMNMNYGGFLRTYVLDQSQLTAVSSALFSPNFWTGLKQKFEGLSDPLQMIVNCIQLPVADINAGTGTMKIGGVEVEDDNGETITVGMTTSRYGNYDMGSVTLKEIWGSAKDYSDTSIQIFLPYVGIKDLDPDVVVGCTLSLKCYVDIWTGDVQYLLHVSNADASKKYFTMQSVPYRWSGNCGKTVPVGRVDNTNKLLGMMGTIAGLGAGAALAGIGAAGLIGGMTAGAAGAVGAASEGMAAGLGTMKAGGAIAGATAAKALHSGFKPTVQSSSGVAGAAGQMDYQYAYIMVKRGVPKYPNGWREQIGATNYQTFQGLSVSGYTLFSEIHLTGMADASEAERAELERLLCEEGVIL